MKNILIAVLVTALVIFITIFAFGAVFVARNYDDIRSQFVGDDGSDDFPTDEEEKAKLEDEKDGSNKEDDPITEDPSDDSDNRKFKYTYDVEVVAYEPDANYVGFRHCDAELSMCYVLGIPAADFAKLLMGQTFTLSYNEIYGYGGGAAAGTSYSLISGDYSLTPR